MKILKYWWIFLGIGIGIGFGTGHVIRLKRRLKKIRAETKKKEQELEYWKEMLKMEEIKRQIEEAKENDELAEEFKRLIKTANDVCDAKDDYELNKVLKQAELDGIYKKPWKGDFKEFMANPDNKLDFG